MHGCIFVRPGCGKARMQRLFDLLLLATPTQTGPTFTRRWVCLDTRTCVRHVTRGLLQCSSSRSAEVHRRQTSVCAECYSTSRHRHPEVRPRLGFIGADLYKLVPGQSIGERDAECVDGVRNGERISPPARIGSLGSVVSSPSGVQGGALAVNGFWWIFDWKTRPDNNNLQFITEILPGQKSVSDPVVLRVPGQIYRCPCGVGAPRLCLDWNVFFMTTCTGSTLPNEFSSSSVWQCLRDYDAELLRT